VLAVPGPITSPTSVGCNKLIQQGAKPALSAGDVLEELGLPRSGHDEPGAETPGRHSEVSRPATPAPPPELSTLQRSLWDMLTAEPKHVDALVAAAGAETGQVLTALTELELKGLVKQQAGMRFCLG